tara:strand:+ start:1163 stop:1642 length:480 start_codon:yes stop_codon:yes gene_type:complete
MSKNERHYDVNLKPLAEGSTGTYQVATGTIELWNKSGNPNSVVLDGETLRFKTSDEIRAEEAPKLIEALYNSAMACQDLNIDKNLDRVMAKADTIVACTNAVDTDYPLCKANGEWLQGLWNEYYIRRGLIESNDVYVADFDSYPSIPNSYMDCVAEVSA